MALTAAVAAALAALAGALAAGGYHLGPLTVAPALYAMALLPGVVAVAAGRRPPPLPRVTFPPATVKVLRFALIGAGLLALSAKGVPEGTGLAVTTLAALAVIVLSWWWPLPPFLRASVALAALAGLGPGSSPGDHVTELAFLGASAAVALVACNRLATADRPVLGGPRRPARPRRVVAEAAIVGLALLVGALLASRTDASGQRPSQARPGAEPGRQQPSPLAYRDVLDPNAAGPGGRRGGDRDEVLLRVDADRPGVLRAVTYDDWDGRRWHRSRHAAEASGVPASHLVPVYSDGSGVQRFPGNLSEQRIRVEATYAGVAVGTPRVYLYDLPGGAEVAVDGTVRLVPGLGRGAVYTAQTGRVDATPDELRAAGTTAGGGALDSGTTSDPSRPPDPTLTDDKAVSGRARALARSLTAGVATDYDKVTALSRYLATHATVDDDVASLAPGADPVDSVLFADQPASAERVATALAVLSRAVGIPARLATGFLPGERPFFGGDFVVRARHAHSWVEVPFTGVGWQRFDPTGRIAAAEHQDSLWSRLVRAWQRYRLVFVLVLTVVAAFVLRRFIVHRRRLAAIPWATRYFARLGRVGAKRGRPRRPSETPTEYAAALASGVLADERLVDVGHVVTAAAWSGREPPEPTRRWAEQVLTEASEATRRTGRARVRPGHRSSR